ncbi:hypothetical protein GCM10027298_28540 [Epidermidibacterium keratini]
MIAAALLYAGCFATWLLWPSFAGFLSGFLLWSISSALTSGTWEALLFDELAADGHAERYGKIRARSESAAAFGALAASAGAGPLYAAGGYRLVGAVTLAITGLHVAATWALPRARPREQVAEPGSYLGSLRDGVREARRNRVVHRILLALVAPTAIVAFDEYLTLLFREGGLSVQVVAWVAAGCVAAQAIGTALADRLAGASRAVSVAVYAGSGLLIGAGALVAHPGGLTAVAVGYGVANAAMLAAEIRLQAAIVGASRATTTSVGGLVSEAAAIISFGLVAVGSERASLATVIGVVAVGFAVVAGISIARCDAPGYGWTTRSEVT